MKVVPFRHAVDPSPACGGGQVGALRVAACTLTPPLSRVRERG